MFVFDKCDAIVGLGTFSIAEWTGLEFGKSLRAVENGGKNGENRFQCHLWSPTTFAVRGSGIDDDDLCMELYVCIYGHLCAYMHGIIGTGYIYIYIYMCVYIFS